MPRQENKEITRQGQRIDYQAGIAGFFVGDPEPKRGIQVILLLVGDQSGDILPFVPILDKIGGAPGGSEFRRAAENADDLAAAQPSGTGSGEGGVDFGVIGVKIIHLDTVRPLPLGEAKMFSKLHNF